MSLTKKAVHGVAWVTVSTIIARVLDFITKIVLARILDPSAFGLIAIGLLTINTMTIFREMGIGASLIYRKEDPDHAAANTALIILPTAACILFAIVYVSAPYIALFFNEPEVTSIIQVLSLTFVISSLGTVPSILLEKELEFKRKVLPETVPRFGYAITALSFAYYGYGVWSLVYGQIVASVLMVTLIWIVSEWKPNFKFDRGVAKELFSYGQHVMSATIIIFILTNIDDAIVGRMLSTEALGFYTMAYLISNLPATQITHLIGRVMFPTYSKLQDEKEDLKNAYIKTLEIVTTFSIPASLGLLVIAPEFTSIVLGEKWTPAIPAIQVLCVFGMLRSIAATFGPIYNATGNPQILKKYSFLQLISLLLLILPFTKYLGIVGTSLAVVLSQLITMSLHVVNVSNIINEQKSIIYRTLMIPFLLSLLMSVILLLTEKIFFVQSMLDLSIIIIYGMGIYLILNIVFNKETFIILKNIMH
jgi:O-antigen/teichoic acid export membrane protein